MSGDERPGDELYCLYCGAPCRVKTKAGEEDCVIEEDF
jgi:hypothetical protein